MTFFNHEHKILIRCAGSSRFAGARFFASASWRIGAIKEPERRSSTGEKVVKRIFIDIFSEFKFY